MILDKLDLYINESNYKEQLELEIPCCFDKLLELLVISNENKREKIISVLDEDTKQKVQDMIDGGVL